ncbi:hypothetical protein AGABI1DRAFT_130977 [Agaricus bisporus var. burnettii JB137-S8]|uniref:Uncharacterized protein n=2 Tax=Agaricus bisporus var. burnettii TaxID=192524 RepID=K5X1B2_AGABU|nr:uncharacterized protein AGABI1DRAFT_130977 [Agaricus bisporus var. burnettii JB137-S8]EKM76682.1 hypothetical protein AGABI1DRAFT_130977 [Agaricus bisporus var. burnettii JB137-S8]KAF7763907.1 hypothetical protein Agabi119p4_8444 [Agaricus bisporus var. burnettii]
MPAFSFHRPRFLRFGRSRSTVDACDDTGDSSAGLDLSHLEPSLNTASVDFSGRTSSASRSVTPTVPILTSRDSVTIQLAPPSDDTHSAQAQQCLAPPPSSHGLATSSQQSGPSETTIPPAGPDSSHLRQQNGMFGDAHNFSMTASTFVDSNKGNSKDLF